MRKRESQRDDHGAVARAGGGGGGGVQPSQQRRKGDRGWIDLLGQMATGLEERKGKNRNLFQNWFLALEK
jgi:hypothetical protein